MLHVKPQHQVNFVLPTFNLALPQFQIRVANLSEHWRILFGCEHLQMSVAPTTVNFIKKAFLTVLVCDNLLHVSLDWCLFVVCFAARLIHKFSSISSWKGNTHTFCNISKVPTSQKPNKSNHTSTQLSTKQTSIHFLKLVIECQNLRKCAQNGSN